MVPQLVFEQVRTGGDRNFGYLLADRHSGEAVLIDPSPAADAAVERAQAQHLRVTCIINTHGHADHTSGNTRAVEITKARVAAHPEAATRPDVLLAAHQEMSVGALRLRFLHTPGHADDHLVIYELTHGLLISGDLLFVGKVGGTATEAQARTEWTSLQRVLDSVSDTTTVWPGHDYGVRPSSTIALERKTNPFLLCRNVDEFLALKASWPQFKQQHGLR
jgi:glyoxylase-like metal-dependent hydrolase (beta-lactamase superfamily II)